MSAVGIVASLFRYGQRLGSKPYMPMDKHYRLELSGERPRLSYHEVSIDAPDCKKHGSPNSPWYGYDSATYALGFDLKRGTNFYARLEADLLRAKLLAPIKALPNVLEYLHGLETSEKNGVVTVAGLNADTSCEPDKKTGTIKLSKNANIVPTWCGVPVIHHEAFRRGFRHQSEQTNAEEESLLSKQAAQGDADAFRRLVTLHRERAEKPEETGVPTHMDLVTGESCVPAETHDQVKGILGTGGWAPLISAKFSAYAYHRPVRALHSFPVLVQQKKGENFPVSKTTSRTYVLGLQRAIKIPVPTDTQDTSFALWPEEGVEHPIIGLAKEFFTSWFETAKDSEVYWARVRVPLDKPDAVINILMLRGGLGRIAVLDWTQMPASEIQRALLRLYDAFRSVTYRFSFMNLRLKADPKGISVIDPIRAPIAWALITGTSFPEVLTNHLSQLFMARPISGSKEECESQLHRNIRMIAAWSALMKGQPMTETTNDTPIEESWVWEAEHHPSRHNLDLKSGSILEVFGILIGLAEFMPVFYYYRDKHHALTHRREEWSHATSNPQEWLGSLPARLSPYERRFLENGFRKGRTLWDMWLTAHANAQEAITNRPIPPTRLGDVAKGYFKATRWAGQFFRSKRTDATTEQAAAE